MNVYRKPLISPTDPPMAGAVRALRDWGIAVHIAQVNEGDNRDGPR